MRAHPIIQPTLFQTQPIPKSAFSYQKNSFGSTYSPVQLSQSIELRKNTGLSQTIQSHSNPIRNRGLFAKNNNNLHQNEQFPNHRSHDGKTARDSSLEFKNKPHYFVERETLPHQNPSRGRKMNNLNDSNQENFPFQFHLKNPPNQPYNTHSFLHTQKSSTHQRTPSKQEHMANKDIEFYIECYNHIMIQNNCLTKRVQLKEMELNRIKKELQVVRDKWEKKENKGVSMRGKIYESDGLMDSFGTNDLVLSISSDDNALSNKDDDSPKRIVPKVYDNIMIQEEEEREDKEELDAYHLEEKPLHNDMDEEGEVDNSEAGFSANSKKLLKLLREMDEDKSLEKSKKLEEKEEKYGNEKNDGSKMSKIEWLRSKKCLMGRKN